MFIALNFIDEVTHITTMKELTIKQNMAIKYNQKFIWHDFEEKDIVLHKKLQANDQGKELPN